MYWACSAAGDRRRGRGIRGERCAARRRLGGTARAVANGGDVAAPALMGWALAIGCSALLRRNITDEERKRAWVFQADILSVTQ